MSEYRGKLRTPTPYPPQTDSLCGIIYAQQFWSEETFGPGERTVALVDHLRKELDEVLDSGGELVEWMDVVILALDGAWRCGHSPAEIVSALLQKQAENRARKWPDWRTAEPGKAIEHIRDKATLCPLPGTECDHAGGCDTCQHRRAEA